MRSSRSLEQLCKQRAIKQHNVLLLCKSLFICHIYQALGLSHLFLPQKKQLLITSVKTSCPNKSQAIPKTQLFRVGDNVLRAGAGSCGTACSHRPVCSHLLHCERAWRAFCFVLSALKVFSG